jgi:DNA-binding CsgD family transcriptional regulator
MNRQHAILAQVINAIGERDFVALAADALAGLVQFDLSAVIIHNRQARPVIAFDNFDRAGGRQGLENYVRFTHRINPMLARAHGARIFRASEFAMHPITSADGIDDYLIQAPDEELGFRTIGWPERMEEIGLYFEACGGLVELSFYRQRGRNAASTSSLRSLEALYEPIAAAFNRHDVLGRARPPAEPEDLSRLSPREREIAELLLIGCSSEAIALRLGLSRFTVKDYRKQIFRKLGIGSLAELFALRRSH